MPAYDAAEFDPPAPVAEVSLRRKDEAAGGTVVGGVRLLIDSGADATLLPRSAIDRLGLQPARAAQYELVGFDGTRSFADSVELDMLFLGKAFRGRYLLTDNDRGIVGRDVLSSLVLMLNGPSREWTEIK
jgi:hypothetical protein